MRFFAYFLVLFIPILSFGSIEELYVQSFIDCFQEKKFDESLQILEDWESSQTSSSCRILGMKSAVYLAVGDLEKSKGLMSECIQKKEMENVLDPLLDQVISMYYKALENNPEDFFELIHPCKLEQPKGVKLKYWFGVGQILVGILAAPFSGGTSTALILSGAAMVVDAASDAIDNKETWERELRDRQRINPSFQNNSFSSCLPNIALDLIAI